MPKTSNLSSQTQKARKKQIEKLRQQKFAVSILQADAQYKVEFSVKYEGTTSSYSIVINLPPNFPNDPPVLFIQPPCFHKYLDAAQLVIDLPALQNFKKKPDLSSVIRHLIAEFEKNPPIPLVLNEFENVPPHLVTEFEAPKVRTGSDIKPSSSIEKLHSGPVPKEILPELEDLSLEELQELDTDETQLLALLHGTEMAKDISRQREEINEKVETIANENISKSEQLVNLREKLLEKYETCKILRDEYEKNIIKFNEASEWMTLPNLSLNLQVLAAEQDHHSENLVEKFLDGNCDATTFIKEFRKSKTVATLRKVKEDKIRRIMSMN